MKYKWRIVGLLVGVFSLVVVGGTALAQESDDGSSPVQNLASRVAEILNLDEATVQDALDQARQDLATDVTAHRLDKLVENGVLTQEQADEYSDWFQARPDNPGFGGPFMGRRGFHRAPFSGGGPWSHGHHGHDAMPPATDDAPAEGATTSTTSISFVDA